MKIIGSILFLLIVKSSIVSTIEKCAPMRNVNTKLFCYYSKLEDVNSCKCSHVILPSNSDVKSVENLRNKLTGAKILITVHEFNEGLIELLKKTKVDGLEIDLRKVDSRSDINDFVSTARNKLGSDLYTAVSIPPKADLLAKYYDFKGLTKNVDSFILQTAFLGPSKNVTFHPSRLSGLWDMQNADSVVDLVTGLGAPLSKLVIAAPVQAFQFTLQDEKHTAPGSPALEIRSITREDLCQKITSSNWTLERDQDQAGPYIFRQKEWIAFDDPMSIDIKAKYARVRGLAGLALKDLSQDGGSDCGGLLLEAALNGLSKQSRAPRGAVLQSLEREILTPVRPLDNIHVSPYRITRIIDTEGKIHAVRQDTRTEFECSRQGYFVHPRSCNRFYRCVKFNQLSDEYNVFEFDCPAGLAFDSRVEVCVWPGSLSHGSACSGSSEIAPVPRERFVCPHEAGYYADPENCRWFFACLDHGKSGLTPYEFRCPFGLVFDQDRLVCEWPWLVPKCVSGSASGVLVEFYGGAAYGINGHALGVNGVVDGSGAYVHGSGRLGGSHGTIGAIGIDRPHGVVLENYNGLGVLQPIVLGGIHGPIEEPEAKVYSSFSGGHGLGVGQGIAGGDGQGIAVVGVDDGADIGHGAVGANIHDGSQHGVLLTQNIGLGQLSSSDQYNLRGAAKYQPSLLDTGLGGKSTVTHYGNLAASGNLGGKLVAVDGSQGGALLSSSQGTYTGADNGVLLSQNIGLGQLDTSDQGHLRGNANYQANLLDAGLAGKTATTYYGNLGANLVGVGVSEGGALLSSGQSDYGQNTGGVLLSQNIGLGATDAGHRGFVRYQASDVDLNGNLGAKSTVSYHGNLGGANANGHALVNAGEHSLGQQRVVLVQNEGDQRVTDERFGQRGSAKLQIGSGLLNVADERGKSTITYHGNFGRDRLGILNTGDAGIQIGAGLVNGADLGGKSTVTYYGNFGGADNVGGHVSTSSGGLGVLTTGEKGVLLQNSGYVHGGYLGNQRFTQRGSVKFQTGGDLISGIGQGGKSTVTYHGNFGKPNQVLVDQGGYTINSPIDRASLAFGTKLRGTKIDADAIITGEKFASNYIQNNDQNDDLKLTNQVLVGSQGVLGHNIGGIGVLTTKDDSDSGSIYHGQLHENVGDAFTGTGSSDGVILTGVDAIKTGILDGAKISQNTVTYHGNLGNAKELGVTLDAADVGISQANVINAGLLQGGAKHRVYQTVGEGDSLEFNKDSFSTLNRGSVKYQTNLGDNLGSINLGQVNQHGGGSTSYQNFNRHKTGNVNIVGGGFSAVGVYPNTYKQTTADVQTVTASPVSVTPIPVTASEIPVVTSVPIPITNTNDKLDVYNGNGVVANVPELQIKVESPGEVIIPNIQQTHTASTGAALEVVEGGYIYDKPAIPFVETGAKFVENYGPKSFVHHNLEHLQPVKTTIPIATAETPAVSIQPVVVSTERPYISTFGIKQTGNINLYESPGYQYPKPAIAFEDKKFSIRPNAEDYSITQPVSTISSVHFGSALVDNRPSFVGESIVSQPVQTLEVSTVRPTSYSNVQNLKSTFIENISPSVHVQPVQPIHTYNTVRPIIKQKIARPVSTISSVHFGSSIVDNVTPSVLVQPVGETIVKQSLQPIQVSTVRPVSYSSVHHVNSGTVENVTPSVLVQPLGETIVEPVHKTVFVERKKPAFSVSSVHFGTGAAIENVTPSVLLQPTQDTIIQQPNIQSVEINKFKSATVENVSPSVLIQPVQESIIHYPAAEQKTHVGNSYFYQNDEPLKSPNIINVTPTVPIASFSFQNFGSRGFERQGNLNVQSVTPASVLLQQEVKQPISVIHTQDNLPDVHSTFLSSISKSHGFTKYTDLEGGTPATQPIQTFVINDAGVGNIGESESYEIGKTRGSIKFTGTHVVTPPTVLQESLVPVQPIHNVITEPGHSYHTFGLKTDSVLEQGSAYYEGQKPRTGYYYPKPAIEFNGEPAVSVEYQGLEPVKEEPFVAKTAYVTGGKYNAQNINGFGSNIVYEENYPITASPIPSSTPIFVTSTIRPSYQGTVQSIHNSIPSTTVRPSKFYYHDSRLLSTPRPFSVKTNTIPTVTLATPRVIISTPKPIIPDIPLSPINYNFGVKSTVVPIIPNVAVTQSKPIFKYSFSSLDSQYSTTPVPIEIDVTKRPVYNRVRVTTPVISTYQPIRIKSTTVQPFVEVANPINVPSNAYLPATTVVENYEAPVLRGRPGKVVNLFRPRSKAIVKVNDFHPLLSAKLGAQCTCITDNLRLRNKPVTIQIDDGENIEEFIVKPDNTPDLLGISEGESIRDTYVGGGGLTGGDNLNILPDYESQKVVAITPLPEVTIGSTTLAPPISRTPLLVRKRVRVRPIQSTTPIFIEAPVTKATDVFLKSTQSFDYQLPAEEIEPETENLNKAVRTGLNAVKQAARQGAEEALRANNFDRYGPGGLRSKTEILQGTTDCQRAGLFRHPTECNKFYSCRWDCTKNKFTLHVFNCPVSLTFDDSLGACNWPSQGPACLGNTLLPSD